MKKPDIKELPIDLRRWATGDCFAFALALSDAAFYTDGIELLFGCHSSKLGIEHVFVYSPDENVAYDVFGAHDLPYIINDWEDSYDCSITKLANEFVEDSNLVGEAEEAALEIWQDSH